MGPERRGFGVLWERGSEEAGQEGKLGDEGL